MFEWKKIKEITKEEYEAKVIASRKWRDNTDPIQYEPLDDFKRKKREVCKVFDWDPLDRISHDFSMLIRLSLGGVQLHLRTISGGCWDYDKHVAEAEYMGKEYHVLQKVRNFKYAGPYKDRWGNLKLYSESDYENNLVLVEKKKGDDRKMLVYLRCTDTLYEMNYVTIVATDGNDGMNWLGADSYPENSRFQDTLYLPIDPFDSHVYEDFLQWKSYNSKQASA